MGKNIRKNMKYFVTILNENNILKIENSIERKSLFIDDISDLPRFENTSRKLKNAHKQAKRQEIMFFYQR